MQAELTLQRSRDPQVEHVGAEGSVVAEKVCSSPPLKQRRIRDARPVLDALCGEYLVGTLRGAARRRFERALREEPLVGGRL